jgi:hypothetical protein
MSGLDIIPIQDAITAYIKDEFPGYEVYEDDVLDDESLLKVSNKVKPYIVLRWGGLFRNARGANFAGVRFDEYISTVDVSIVAPTPRQCRLAMNVINDKLIGWKVDGIAPLIPEGSGGSFAIPDLQGRPPLYIQSNRFTFAVNYTDPGSPIQP